MGRRELTDEQWDRLMDLLPANRGRGWRYKDHRTVLNGMLWILQTGAPWRDPPERYGPWQTAYDRFNRWRRDGTLDRLLEALHLHIRLNRQGRVDRGLWCVAGRVGWWVTRVTVPGGFDAGCLGAASGR